MSSHQTNHVDASPSLARASTLPDHLLEICERIENIFKKLVQTIAHLYPRKIVKYRCTILSICRSILLTEKIQKWNKPTRYWCLCIGVSSNRFSIRFASSYFSRLLVCSLGGRFSNSNWHYQWVVQILWPIKFLIRDIDSLNSIFISLTFKHILKETN